VAENTFSMANLVARKTMTNKQQKPDSKQRPATRAKPSPAESLPKEINGPKGPEPTRYGDWERKGRCSDF
jgi:hypothetical protein